MLQIFMFASKMTMVISIVYLMVAELVDGAIDTANKVGTMGMQSLLALMMIVLGIVIWYLEKKRAIERLERDRIVLEQYNNLLVHHEISVKEVSIERGAFQLEMKAHSAELRGLTERSILAMHAMATSTDALREWLKERQSNLPLPQPQPQQRIQGNST